MKRFHADLMISDTEYGTDEFGFLPRVKNLDQLDDEDACDLEDRVYQSYMRQLTNDNSWKVRDGVLWYTE